MGDRFDGKVAWVTGGGSGIGRALVLELARQGATVAVSGRRVERLDEVVAAITEAGGQASAVPCDVTDEGTLRAAVAQIVERHGQLDVAVANAGYAVGRKVEKLEADELRRQLEVNVVGAAMTAKHALPELRKTSGRLGLVGSVASMLVYPGGGAYCASKFALRGLGLTLALELAGSGVSVTMIYPGFVESEIALVDNQGVLHDDWNDKRPKKLMWTADKAAAVIARALHRRKREFVFTGHGKVGAWVGRHLPGFAHFAMTRGKGASPAD